MSDVEHAFARSEDGQFLAIDRYLIPVGGKQVIGVLGDGLLPLTVATGADGEESVRVDFARTKGGTRAGCTL